MYPSSNSCNYSPIPSPCMHYEHEHDLFFQYYQEHLLQQPQTPLPTTHDDQNLDDDALAESTETAINMTEEKGCKNKKTELSSTTRIQRNKRASNKKDRHSKINTARGPRDRRIRLSIDIARKFFSLQDILRLDKASKTMEWLFIKSKSAIKELSRGPLQRNSASSTGSECEVVSGDESPSNNQNHKENAKGDSCNKEKKKKKKARPAHIRAAFHHPFAKESRKQARERARERTRLKKIFAGSKLSFEAMAHDLNLRSWSSFERGEQSGHTSANHPSHEMQAEVEELTSHHKKQLFLGTQEKTVTNNDGNLVATGNWNPYAIFNYQ
ncbi:transcription factor DICHOTOMA-like [Lycium ferocissimum]|uniref:transcription factor DICHOTOMA-like n=1 Tax=Lycium ferocissimum TaxID=112874 RepID=UPI00281576FA|nr:transcription factor DICHOTOMA-like [Lycium ferocissimum]XP_059286648.1 transcription factor DICHOTOMA-like [Lycium ferocissimum]